jgi:hypothetical protein
MDTSRERSKYLSLMWEIGMRLDVLREFSSGRASTTYPQTDIESQALQLRKVLELIAYSSLVPNRKAYEAVRSDIRKDWHANRIIAKIERINPNFYPIPIERLKGNTTQLKRSGFLTKRQFVQLYDRCGTILHAKNPFSRVSQRSFAFQKTIPGYVTRIEGLLFEHIVRFAKPGEELYVRFPMNSGDPYFAAYLVQPKASTSVVDA